MPGKVGNNGRDTKSRSEPIPILVKPKSRGFLARGTRGFFVFDDRLVCRQFAMNLAG